MSDLLEMVWYAMQAELAQLKARIALVEIRTERAETAGGIATSALTDAPLAADNAADGDLLFITDGRKSGEGVGAGTGVPAYYNGATDSWFRFSDDTAVQV